MNYVAALLGVAFIILKLVGVIAWPWIWVLAPFWVGIALLVLIFLVSLILLAIAEART